MPTRIQLNTAAVLNSVESRFHDALDRFGTLVTREAVRSMEPQVKKSFRDKKGRMKTVYGRTPAGEPPRTREGLIRDNISHGFLSPIDVIIGPEALPGHNTDCLLQLETSNHPYMHPAFESQIPTLPHLFG